MNPRRVALLAAVLATAFLWRLDTPWRRIQAAALDAEETALRARLETLRTERADDLRFLEGEAQVARDEYARRGTEIAEAERGLGELARKLRSAEARAAAPSDDASARVEVEALREQVAIQQTLLDDWRAGLTAAEEALAGIKRPIDEAARRLDALDGPAAWLRSVPGLRAFAPGIGARAAAPIGWLDLDASPAGSASSASPAPRVDRCITCHVGMSDLSDSAPDVETGPWGRLLAPHPRTDLFVAMGSTHPLGGQGCTACHGGEGLALDFADAGHVAPDEETAQRWRALGMSVDSNQGSVARPILAGAAVEAGCVTCHDTPWLAGAPTQQAGRVLARQMACSACHATGRADLEDLPRAPSLVDLPRRKTRAFARAFLADPNAWKPTFMPSFWSRTEPAERDAEVDAIVAWLWSGAGPDPAAVDAVDTEDATVEVIEQGARLFRGLACTACHLADFDALAPTATRGAHLGSERLRGPNLGRLAEETTSAEVVAERLRSGHAPDLRLRGAEAERLAAYLFSLGPGSTQPDTTTVDPDVTRRLLLAELRRSMTIEASEAKVASLDAETQRLLLGELAVARRGCAGCHDLPGSAPPMEPAGSLADIGALLDASDLAGWRPHPAERTDLPRWHLSDEEARALGIQLAGWRPPPSARTVAQSAPERAAGHAVMARRGCLACHEVTDGPAGGQVGGWTQDFTGADERPPSLADAGAKLRAEWVFRALDDPGSAAIRPWMSVRMPRFDLTPTERAELAEGFAAEAGLPSLTPRASRTATRLFEARHGADKIDAAQAAERALGAAVFDLLQCDRCHAGAGAARAAAARARGVGDDELRDAEADPFYRVAKRAPDYDASDQRLRHEWLVRWILDPASLDPRTTMPEVFLRGADPESSPGTRAPSDFDATYMLAILEAPMFDVQRTRLERFFATRDDLEAAFDDPRRVAEALAAHVASQDRR